ncbi:hypothetical protein DFJ58DRAFT_723360 [Suillus subalutaceus]|uniref:uncharacterized protein n=1 Tax=Suillus subalutaceus TaxID=48586 RepID=UPI001B87A250|nr:uncharacterized protein DFJ58DRAFT_723360 [Suillus subalutaceus]KAG1868953.1 hypothetical protein DFJ58DRAFT_723360 [Suillus subalutaceus]
MAIINLSLESMKDDYLAATVKLEAENYYQLMPDKLFVSTLRMCSGAHVSVLKKLAPGLQFLWDNTATGFPPNTFIVINTHSDEWTGMLQHTGGSAGGTSTSIGEIPMVYLGEECLDALMRLLIAARSHKTEHKMVNGRAPWCNLSAHGRGGWRGVFMVSCGPAIGVVHHFDQVMALVRENKVDFVLAFGGSGTLLSMISSAVHSLLLEIGVFSEMDIWSALCKVLSTSNDLLDYTTVVLVYAITSKSRPTTNALSNAVRSARTFMGKPPAQEDAEHPDKGKGKKGGNKKGKAKHKDVAAHIKEGSEMVCNCPDSQFSMDVEE